MYFFIIHYTSKSKIKATSAFRDFWLQAVFSLNFSAWILGKWMTQEYTERKVLPKSPIGIAMAYSIKRWDKLMRYTTNGMLSIDNNPVENSLRPVALGRKNYLFAGSHEAAQRMAMIYSMVGSCKMQGVNPYLRLKDVLTRISMHPINKIKELLPHYWKQTQVQDTEIK